MRYLMTLFVLMFALGFDGQALAEDDTTMDSQAYQEEEEFAAFEADDLATDDYGAYDEDFIWDTDEDWYGDWYGDSGDYWEDYEYTGYDDPGDATRTYFNDINQPGPYGTRFRRFSRQ